MPEQKIDTKQQAGLRDASFGGGSSGLRSADFGSTDNKNNLSFFDKARYASAIPDQINSIIDNAYRLPLVDVFTKLSALIEIQQKNTLAKLNLGYMDLALNRAILLLQDRLKHEEDELSKLEISIQAMDENHLGSKKNQLLSQLNIVNGINMSGPLKDRVGELRVLIGRRIDQINKRLLPR